MDYQEIEDAIDVLSYLMRGMDSKQMDEVIDYLKKEISYDLIKAYEDGR